MGMFRVKEFAAYVSQEYYDKFNKNISPVRLQKTLYFCFAYWGGFVRKGNLQEEDKREIDVSSYDESLFETNFQAWAYGPVIPDIYFEKDLMRFYNSEMFKGKDDVKQFIDELLDEINNVSDFRLVDISHQDDSWKNNFIYDEEHHNRSISKEEIITEYARK